MHRRHDTSASQSQDARPQCRPTMSNVKVAQLASRKVGVTTGWSGKYVSVRHQVIFHIVYDGIV